MHDHRSQSPSLSLLVLKTPQIERLREFYSLIGVNFIQEQHGSGPLHFAARLGTVVVEIYPLSSGESVDRSTRLGFSVLQLDSLLERLAQAGVPTGAPAKQTQWGYRAVVHDPDGRKVELTET